MRKPSRLGAALHAWLLLNATELGMIALIGGGMVVLGYAMSFDLGRR